MKRSPIIGVGISAAVIIGYFTRLWSIQSNDYAYYRMYATILQMLVSRIDVIMLLLAGVYLSWYLCRLCARFHGVARLTLSLLGAAVPLLCVFCVPEVRAYVVHCAILAMDFWNRCLEVDPFASHAALFALAAGALLLLIIRGLRKRGAVVNPTPMRNLGARSSAIAFWPRFMFSSLLSAFVVIFVLLHVFAGITYASAALADKSRPNVIWITIDTLREDHLSCYGYGRKTSPNLDRLADEGLLFTGAYAQAPWTTWSVCSFLTSRYPETIGLSKTTLTGDNPSVLDNRYLTLGEVLRDYGYSTAAVNSNGNISKGRNCLQGFDWVDEKPAFYEKPFSSITSSAIKWLRQPKSSNFFLFMFYLGPHGPYVKEKGFDFSSDSYQGPFKSRCDIYQPAEAHAMATSATDRQQGISLYDSCIARTDAEIGRLVEYLKRNGLYDNTMIIVTADHGEEFMEHGGLGHGDTLYNELLHVPLVVKLPGQHRKRVIPGSFALANLYPSILKTIGFSPPSGRAGFGFELNSIRAVPNSYVFSSTEFLKPLRSVLEYPYKYILSLDTGKGTLYDLQSDPGETLDISNAQPLIAARLDAVLKDHVREMSAQANAAPAPKTVVLSDREKNVLRSLGYMQ
jgi:arylsulfatase A-like enzyme